MDCLHRFHDIRADTVHVGDAAVRPDEDAPVDAAAQVFRKIAVDVTGNRSGGRDLSARQKGQYRLAEGHAKEWR